ESVSDTSYVYSLRARKTGGNEGFLIIFGYQDQDNFYWWNLGGWGNTKHAIERCVDGSKSILTEVSGSIQTNVWYNIKIEVTPSTVYCYLNDELIQSFDVPASKLLYTSASLDEKDGQIYLKVVNPTDTDVETKLNFKGMATDTLNAELITLTSESTTDENSMTKPENVYPATIELGMKPISFKYTIAANSVNIFKVNESGKTTWEKEQHKQAGFSVYPNPVNNYVTVHFNDQQTLKVQVLDASGAIVISRQVKDESRIDLSQLSPGIYFVGTKIFGVKKVIKY
ncbi:MAG TPA: T9SS type A sorting domain-containing protein, partial [Bacteroidales bacterium]|nr:T9SS type A sorting domain-containing protein [Bacteroidales bacterium]